MTTNRQEAARRLRGVAADLVATLQYLNIDFHRCDKCESKIREDKTEHDIATRLGSTIQKLHKMAEKLEGEPDAVVRPGDQRPR